MGILQRIAGTEPGHIRRPYRPSKTVWTYRGYKVYEEDGEVIYWLDWSWNKHDAHSVHSAKCQIARHINKRTTKESI